MFDSKKSNQDSGANKNRGDGEALFCKRSFEGKKILVADDNPQILAIVKEMLENEGFKVVAIKSLEDIFFIIRNSKPDLIILDIMMPHSEGLDGFDICRRIKDDPQYKDLPVILFSSITEGTATTASQLCTSTGADAYISKPFKASTMIGKIKELLLYSAK